MAFRKLFFKRVQGIRDNYLLQEGDIALDEDDFKLYRGDGSTIGGIVISGAGGGSGIALTDISVTQASASGAGTLAYNSSTGVLTYTPPTASGLGAKTSVSQADVTQHQSALSITESQISDFGTYLTSVPAQTFASLTGKPTTVAGYGITDVTTSITGGDLDMNGNKVLFSNLYATTGDLPNASNYNGMFAVATNTGAGYFATGGAWVKLANNSELGNYTTTANLPSAIDSHLNQSDPTSGYVLSWDGADYAWVAQSGGGSGLQSRSTATGTTGSLADAAETDLDITGFKSYMLATITTNRAARVRLYTTAAARTADASRAEGTDPTSDAGVIAEVITTGAETVTISPGALGFNLESPPTTTIPCRVTNKSGGTSTVQVNLHVLQLES